MEAKSGLFDPELGLLEAWSGNLEAWSGLLETGSGLLEAKPVAHRQEMVIGTLALLWNSGIPLADPLLDPLVS